MPFLLREKYLKCHILFSKIVWATYRESPHYVDFGTWGITERGAPHLTSCFMMIPLLSLHKKARRRFPLHGTVPKVPYLILIATLRTNSQDIDGQTCTEQIVGKRLCISRPCCTGIPSLELWSFETSCYIVQFI